MSDRSKRKQLIYRGWETNGELGERERFRIKRFKGSKPGDWHTFDEAQKMDQEWKSFWNEWESGESRD